MDMTDRSGLSLAPPRSGPSRSAGARRVFKAKPRPRCRGIFYNDRYVCSTDERWPPWLITITAMPTVEGAAAARAAATRAATPVPLLPSATCPTWKRAGQKRSSAPSPACASSTACPRAWPNAARPRLRPLSRKRLSKLPRRPSRPLPPSLQPSTTPPRQTRLPGRQKRLPSPMALPRRMRSKSPRPSPRA